MTLYYTTAQAEDVANKKIDYSLGGFKSSTRVPSGLLGNLFSEISLYTLDKLQDEYIALMLKNETGSDITGVSLWFEYSVDGLSAKTNLANFQVAAVTPSVTDNSIETITSKFEKPYVGTFYNADGASNAVSLGGILKNKCIGLWIKRSIIPAMVTNILDFTTLNANFGTNPLKLEDIHIKLSY